MHVKALKEIDLFFEERGEVHQTMQRLVRRLRRARIPHAIVGGMAVNAHGYERMTKDVDVLLSRRGFEQFQQKFVPKFYTRDEKFSRCFTDKASGRNVDILVTGLFPGSGQPGPIAYPDPKDVRQLIHKTHYADLVTLISLKLAARRHRDFGDVVELIRFNELDEVFLDNLHRSQHGDFIECLEEKRREDDYLHRHG